MLLKITHTGKVKNSLFISDISTIELREKGTAFPQYVPYKESVTLPLIDSVVLSLHSGALRGFLRDGMITVTEMENELPFDYEGPVEVWVSTLGDDNNPGTKDFPFRTIRKGMDVAYNVASWKHMKTVNIVSQELEFYETMLVNTPRWHFKGWSDNALGGRVSIVSDPQNTQGKGATEEGYPLTLAPITSQAYESFIESGGINYVRSTGPAGDFLYTGADIYTLERHPCWAEGAQTGAVLDMLVTFENFTFRSRGFLSTGANKTAEAIVAFSNNISTNNRLRNIAFERCTVTVPGGETAVYFKNVLYVSLDRFSSSNRIVLDNSYAVAFGAVRQLVGDSSVLPITINVDQDNPNMIGNTYMPFGRFWSGGDRVFAEIEHYSSVPVPPASGPWSNGMSVEGLTTLASSSLYKDAQWSMDIDPLLYLSTKDLNHHSTGQLHIVELKAFGNLTKTGTGILNVQKTSVKENVAISGGTNNTLADGTIQGNLTVSGGANIDLTNIVVKGNVNLTGAGTVTWKGGSFYGTLTDPLNKLGTVTAGEWLNIG